MTIAFFKALFLAEKSSEECKKNKMIIIGMERILFVSTIV